jgi:hypothetical protein
MDEANVNRVLYFDSEFGQAVHDDDDDKFLTDCLCVQDKNVVAKLAVANNLEHLKFQGKSCPFADVAQTVLAAAVFNQWLQEPSDTSFIVQKLERMRGFQSLVAKFNSWAETNLSDEVKDVDVANASTVDVPNASPVGEGQLVESNASNASKLELRRQIEILERERLEIRGGGKKTEQQRVLETQYGALTKPSIQNILQKIASEKRQLKGK